MLATALDRIVGYYVREEDMLGVLRPMIRSLDAGGSSTRNWNQDTADDDKMEGN